ncbi:hypothetical protein CEXT_708091 [Caerostris extrusa]|uniref:Uncharacterized protein n=1 Tax=Caerostris extrusa TaxID=172846 RepID=A0AAV4UXD6_CAEEX|nr:hypothetical protein CEXT_708091 [Caerostris extrusa]
MHSPGVTTKALLTVFHRFSRPGRHSICGKSFDLGHKNYKYRAFHLPRQAKQHAFRLPGLHYRPSYLLRGGGADEGRLVPCDHTFLLVRKRPDCFLDKVSLFASLLPVSTLRQNSPNLEVQRQLCSRLLSTTMRPPPGTASRRWFPPPSLEQNAPRLYFAEWIVPNKRSPIFPFLNPVFPEHHNQMPPQSKQAFFEQNIPTGITSDPSSQVVIKDSIKFEFLRKLLESNRLFGESGKDTSLNILQNRNTITERRGTI